MSRPDRLQKRSEVIRKYISQLEKKHPQWRWDALLEEAESVFFLAPRTIDAILKKEPPYNH